MKMRVKKGAHLIPMPRWASEFSPMSPLQIEFEGKTIEVEKGHNHEYVQRSPVLEYWLDYELEPPFDYSNEEAI